MLEEPLYVSYPEIQGGNFWGGVVAKPWYFTVLAGSPPKKITFLVLTRVGPTRKPHN